MHRLQELVRLHRMGVGGREVARLLKMSSKTELKYRQALAEAGLLEGDAGALPDADVLRDAVLAVHPRPTKPQTPTSVDPWMPAIEEAFKNGVQAKAVWDFLNRKEADFTASYTAVRRAFQRLRKHHGVREDDVVIPVDTAAGEVAQVDFGFVGRLFDPVSGRIRKAWVFVMVLGYSRHMFAKVAFDQKTTTWLQLHVDAFRHFRAVPRVVVPDNLKAAVVQAAFGASDRHRIELNRSYRELARHYGFKIDPTPVYAPEKKGKVESGVKYVKNNCLAALNVTDIAEVNAELADWVMRTAGQRVHGTTGERPLELFERVERPQMLPLPAQRYELLVWKRVTVHPDSHVQVDGKLYSVPWRHVGRQLWVRASRHSVEIYWDDTRVATHQRLMRDRRSTLPGHLPEERLALAQRSEDYWRRRAANIGPSITRYVDDVLASDPVLSKLRDVQAIVTELEKVPITRALAAVARASFYANYTYIGVRDILRKGLDFEPLPRLLTPTAGLPGEMRFARSADELLAAHKESDHESH